MSRLGRKSSPIFGSMKLLCDSNVFIAITLKSHAHRARAVEWVSALSQGEILYFCRATEQSYLRLLTMKELMQEDVCTNEEAIQTYKKLRSDPRIDFAKEPQGIDGQWFEFASAGTPSPKLWMDAYLAAFAVHSKMRLATFDRGMERFRGLDLEML